MLEDRVQYKFLINNPKYNIPTEIEMVEFNKEEEDFVFLFDDRIKYDELLTSTKKDTVNFTKLLFQEIKNLLNINKWNK